MSRQRLDEEEIFAALARQSKAALLERLRMAFKKMTPSQRAAIFGVSPPRKMKRVKQTAVDPKELICEINRFRQRSFSKKYYAPFNMDSKNYSNVPQATTNWCDEFARLAKDACQLTAKQNHPEAVRSLSVLYELLEAMESGDHQIVFAHELGGWMIPADEKVWLRAYVKSLAATVTPERFAKIVTPMLWRDSIQSFAAEVYASAMQIAMPEQRAAMEAERIRRCIRTPMERSEPRRRV
jgi:hypothetical protein